MEGRWQAGETLCGVEGVWRRDGRWEMGDTLSVCLVL